MLKVYKKSFFLSSYLNKKQQKKEINTFLFQSDGFKPSKS